jgi:GT2 family glycosyltransferase
VSGRPALSIVVASWGARATIERCLSALVPQRDGGAVEIVVVDSGGDGTAALVAERFPEVVLVHSDERRWPGGARNLGVARARGELIGFVDADCMAAPDWAVRVRAAHATPAPIVGGVVDHGVPRTYLGWALYFCEFHQWMPGTPAGPMLDIPTCCLSMKRWAYERYGPFREDGYCSDTAFNWAAARDGFPPVFDPAIRVSQLLRPRALGFARKQLAHGCAFARMRADEERFTAARRAAYAVLAPALPFVLGRRLARRVRAAGVYRGTLVTTAPAVLAGLCLWSAGELWGYATAR